MENSTNFTNATDFGHETEVEKISPDDAAWILSNAFLIITMQTGFGMLEAGCVSAKNVANIMVKNVVDVSLGGMCYWAFGYGLSFGTPSNAFCGYGDFFLTNTNTNTMGTTYATYIFQFSFASAATTIVSGAVAERMKLSSYMIFSALNIFVYCIPASWVWGKKGFLKAMGFYDFAGGCVVHLNGGSSALIAALMIGPRLGRFRRTTAEDKKLPKGSSRRDFVPSSPVTALTGTFMLWWAWLAFNCGSTFGINGTLWKTATKAAVNTMNGSIGGSLVGLCLGYFLSARTSRYFDVSMIISSILGGLVGITSCCSVVTPFESLIIGGIGGCIAVLAMPLMNWLKIDDPVGAIPVHFCSAIWTTLAVGLFSDDEFGRMEGKGLLKGGGFHLLGVQCLGMVCIMVWAMSTTFICFAILKYTVGIRMDVRMEIFGADYCEHNIRSGNFTDKLERAFEELKVKEDEVDQIVAKVCCQCISLQVCFHLSLQSRSQTKKGEALQMMSELLRSNAPKVESSVRNFVGGSEHRTEVTREELEEIKSVIVENLEHQHNEDRTSEQTGSTGLSSSADRNEDSGGGANSGEGMGSRKRRMHRGSINVFTARRHKTQQQPL